MSKNLYMCQITPADETIGGMSECEWAFLPYTAGVLWEYAHRNELIKNNYILKDTIVFRDPLNDILDSLDHPDVVAFCCYVWNTSFQSIIAKKIKEIYPNCLIIVGGPHIPIKQDKWFKDHPYIDIAVVNEGEEIFENVLLEGINDIPDYSKINGIILNDTNDILRTPSHPRMKDLDVIPSPYLTGFFEKLMTDHPNVKFHATWESNRGCPFRCSFCDWGGLTYQKVKIFDINRCKDEITYISDKKMFAMWISDANFGIFKKRDIELVQHLVDIYNKEGYPEFFPTLGYAKTPPKKNGVAEIQKLIREALPFDKTPSPRVAIQSFDHDTLANIRRDNLSIADLDLIVDNQKQNDVPFEVELIIPLPGMTYNSFISDWEYFLQNDSSDGMIYPAMVLPNSEFGAPEYQKKYKIKVRNMPYNYFVSKEFSERRIYTSLDKFKNEHLEYADIIVETFSMSESDVIKCWMFYWVIECFWYHIILKDVVSYISKCINVPLVEVFKKLQTYIINSHGIMHERYSELESLINKSYFAYDMKSLKFQDVKFFQEHHMFFFHDVTTFISEAYINTLNDEQFAEVIEMIKSKSDTDFYYRDVTKNITEQAGLAERNEIYA